MNTQEEMDNTIEDYRNGRIGKIET